MVSIPAYFWIAPGASLCALLFAYFLYRKVLSFPTGTDRMIEIAGYVKEGAYAYLKQQYKTVGIVFAVLTVVFSALAFFGIQNPFVPVAFLTGGFFSGLCGFIGMRTATEASNRTAWGAKESLNKGLQVAFRAGAVMGLIVVGFGLLDISMWYVILNWIYDTNVFGFGLHLAEKAGLATAGAGFDPAWASNAAFIKAKMFEVTTTMLTFGMGASTQALFARVGGGIFTKAADVGADLVGKVEAGIPEDDPRNPAVIADNVGDNVGDVAGMGADLYESYCGAILATASIGSSLALKNTEGALMIKELLAYIVAPMLVAGVGTVLSMIGIFLVRTKEGATQKQLLRALGIGVWVPSVLIAIAIFALFQFLGLGWGLAWAVMVGLAAGIIIGQGAEYYTSDDYAPTKGIATSAKMGYATTIIDGISVGMMSTAIPVLAIGMGIFLSYAFAGGFTDFGRGLYGISFAAVGMLATLGVTLATDAYGPIADNAGGNAEMSHLGPDVRARTDALDMLGNTTAATGKGFAIGSAGLTALALLAAYAEEIRIWIGKLAHATEDGVFVVNGMRFAANSTVAAAQGAIDVTTAPMKAFTEAFDLTLMNPNLLIGTFLGAMMTFIFSAMAMKAVGRAAGRMVGEVRRQFAEIKGIMTGEGKPDYAACVAISTAGAQREMVVPSMLALITPVLVGVLFGVSGVFGLLLGATTTGFCVAVMLNNAGGAWDNSKKFVEKGNFGGKGSDVHKACVIGDTVGDPFKDTAGPSLNILIKLMSMVSVVFAGVVVAHGNVLNNILSAWLK